MSSEPKIEPPIGAEPAEAKADAQADAVSALPTELPVPSAAALRTTTKSTAKSAAKGALDEGPSPFAGLLAEAQEPEELDANGRPHTLQVRERSAQPKTGRKPEEVGPERRVGPYKILEEIGSGGMAVVYKAVQPSLDRLVAIKELRSEYVNDKQIARRFEREATSLATMQHGNIVHIYDYLKDRESAFIVMEYVEGIDLFDVLAETDRLPPEIAALVALQVAEGLEYAHYRGIVHRDIKPSNILLSKTGEVKLMDFGIARDPGKSELTQVGLAVGTPAYMAPEQIRGDRVDFRTDIFALGIVLYEMLAGEKPWIEEEGRSVTVKVLDDPPVPLRSAMANPPPELEAIIARCLAKDPDRRYTSTHEARADLQAYVQRSIPTDPRGRQVLFLRNRGFITDGQASNFVAQEALGDQHLRRLDRGIPTPPLRQLLRPVLSANGAAAALILIALIFAGFAPFGKSLAKERPRLVLASALAKDPPKSIEPPKAKAPAPPPEVASKMIKEPELTGDEGFVKVVVQPWARVFVDKQFHDYTPFAQPLTLPPGEHRIGFRNPYCKPEDRIVVVKPGETQVLKISMVSKDTEEDAPPDTP